jgi:hypothetical protein
MTSSLHENLDRHHDINIKRSTLHPDAKKIGLQQYLEEQNLTPECSSSRIVHKTGMYVQIQRKAANRTISCNNTVIIHQFIKEYIYIRILFFKYFYCYNTVNVFANGGL